MFSDMNVLCICFCVRSSQIESKAKKVEDKEVQKASEGGDL